MTSPRIIITGHAPDRHGWRIVSGDVPVASSTRHNMTEEQAREAARKVLERMGAVK